MYTVATYLHSAVTQKYSPGAFVNVVVTASDSRMVLDAPAAGAVATQPSRGGGWTLDRGATTGTGIDAVHIWAFPVWAGGLGPGRFVGLAQLGIARPDISAVFGSQFAGAGFEFAIAGLPPGQYVITAYAHSVVTGTFSQQTSALVSLQ